MIHETLDKKTPPLFTPEVVYGKHEKICDLCVITFSYKVIVSRQPRSGAAMGTIRSILQSGKGKRSPSI